jgi:flagellar biogenesis protein FliO
MKTYLLTLFFAFHALSFPLFGQTEERQEQAARPENSQADTFPIPPNGETDSPEYIRMDAPLEESIDRTNRETDNFQAKFINMLVMLALLIGLMLLASWFLKRMMRTRLNQMNTSSSIKILETRYISPKTTIHLLDILGKGIVIAESNTGANYLTEISLDEESSDEEPNPPDDKGKKFFLNRQDQI